jgi:hypothetical protein
VVNAPTAPRTIPVTSATDSRTHRIADAAYTAGLIAGRGQYAALCGHRVTAAALVCPPGPDCQGCAAAGGAVPRGGPGRHRRAPRRGRHRGGAR